MFIHVVEIIMDQWRAHWWSFRSLLTSGIWLTNLTRLRRKPCIMTPAFSGVWSYLGRLILFLALAWALPKISHHISQVEMLNMVMALKLSGSERSGKISCDNLGQVFFGLVEPRVRVGVVQDHQRWSTWWENGIWTVSTFTCDDDLNGIRWINVDQRLWFWKRPTSNTRLNQTKENSALVACTVL